MSKSGISLTGDWARLRGFLMSGEEMVDLVNDEVKRQAEQVRDEVIDNIPFWASTDNADSTIRRKGQDAPLEESGGLKKNIDVFDYTDLNGKSYKKYYIVKGNPEAQVESGGRWHDLNYEELLEILENGTSSAGWDGTVQIPPRPILSMTYDRMKTSVEHAIVMKFEREIKRALRR